MQLKTLRLLLILTRTVSLQQSTEANNAVKYALTKENNLSFRLLQVTEVQFYQAVSDVEDDVDRIQAVTDVFPERCDHNHRFSVCPGQVVILVTWKNNQLLKVMICILGCYMPKFITHHQKLHSCIEWWRPVVCKWYPICCHSYQY